MSGMERTRRFLAERGKALSETLSRHIKADSEAEEGAQASRIERLRTPADQTARIERLERELAAARASSAALQRTVDELTFKQGVLEQSYGKQLADARQQADTALQALAETRGRFDTLEVEHAKALELLAASRALLERYTGSPRAVADASAPGASVIKVAAVASNAGLLDGSWLPAQDGSMTINELIDGAGWRRAANTPASAPEISAAAHHLAEEPPTGDLLAPELLLPVRKNEG